MLRFVEKPNLPQGDVRLVLVGEKYSSKLNLQRFGIISVPLPEDPKLEKAVRNHADMQAVHLYRNAFLFDPSTTCKANKLYNNNLQIDADNSCKAEDLYMNIELGSTYDLELYPKSAAYNVLILGEFAFYNPECIDRILKNRISAYYQTVPVRQGYARCSVCVVDEKAAITADRGMYDAMIGCGIEVLLIKPGFIELTGYDYGFIGGASFKISQDKLAFTGVLDSHPDREKILAFLKEHEISPVFLTGEPIFDIGSAVPVLETV